VRVLARPVMVGVVSGVAGDWPVGVAVTPGGLVALLPDGATPALLVVPVVPVLVVPVLGLDDPVVDVGGALVEPDVAVPEVEVPLLPGAPDAEPDPDPLVPLL
jgi:hypothetical protein